MKRTLSWLLVLTLVVLCACPAALADGEINVTINGETVVWSDVRPFIDENDRTLCPLRAVGEAMGLDVSWDPGTRVADFRQSGYYEDGTEYIFTLSFTVGSTTAHWDEYYEDADGGVWGGISDIEMDTAAVLVDNRSYAPVRYLAEAFGYVVEWDTPSRTVVIEDDPGYILSWNCFGNWEDYVGIYFYPGERFDEYGSSEVISATIDGAPAAFEVMSDTELAQLNDEFGEGLDGEAVYAFYIYGDFEDGQTYFIDWDAVMTYADGSVAEPETISWTYDCYGYGGW